MNASFFSDMKCLAVQKMVFAKLNPGQKVNDYAPRRTPGRTVRSDGVLLVNDLCYGEEYPNSHFDLWYPSDASNQKYPVFVYFHGGGFIFGDKVVGDPLAVGKGRDVDLCAEICKKGFCVVNANYALAPEYRFPVQLKQVDQLLCHLVEHAGEYSLDADNFILSGGSAGADLTEMYGVLLCSPDYAAQLGIAPQFEKHRLRALLIDEAALNTQHFNDDMNAMLGCWPGTDHLSEKPEAKLLNTATWIRQEYLPSFINSSNQEIWFEDSARELAAILEQNGTEHELFYRGPEHGALQHGYMQAFTENACARECFEQMIQFAVRHLKGKEE